jgi:hypothetical protein
MATRRARPSPLPFSSPTTVVMLVRIKVAADLHLRLCVILS